MLDIVSSNLGLLIPRVALTASNAAGPITSPTTSLMVYNTATAGTIPNAVTPGFYYWNGTKWVSLSGGASGNNWSITGNAGTSEGTNFIGNTDSAAIVFKVNNHIAGRIGLLNNAIDNNTSFGNLALYRNTTGANNTAIGTQSLNINTSGGNNTAVGYQSLQSLQSRSNNTAIGCKSLFNNGNSNNTAVGYQTLYQNTTGTHNTGLGVGALQSNDSGNDNVAVGYYALNGNAASTTTQARNVGLGSYAGYNNQGGTDNFFAGLNSGFTNSTGSFNLFVGNQCGYNNTTGGYNLFLGDSAGFSNTVKWDNIFMGLSAGYTNASGVENIFLGNRAGYYNNGSYNLFFGWEAGIHNTTGGFNIFLGAASGASNTQGANNVFLGGLSGISNTSSSNNTYVGIGSGQVTTSANNTLLGYYSGNNTVGGANNTFVGYYSGTGITTNGAYNTFVGANTNATGDFSKSCAIGYNAKVGGSNVMVLGGVAGSGDDVNVGIGVSNPVATLEVNGDGKFYNGLVIDNSNLNSGSVMASSLTFGSGSGEGIGSKRTAGGNQYGLDFYTGFSRRMSITSGGNVGIGTTAPSFPLDVNLSTGTYAPNYAFYAYGGSAVTGVWTGGDNNISIRASGRVLATEFDAYSDARIKKILGITNNINDLNTLMNIKITNYKYIDSIGKGNRTYKKVIAQELEAVYPIAVSKHTDVVPDIYRKTEICEGRIYLRNNLKVGEKVKLIFDNSTELVEVEQADATGFVVNSKANGNVFVFGREVNDFRTVDYEALSTLNISATQQLAKENVELKKIVTKQSETIEQLKEDVKNIQVLLKSNNIILKPDLNINVSVEKNKINTIK